MDFISNEELARKKAIIMQGIISKVKHSKEKIVKIVYLSEQGEYLDEMDISLEKKKILDKVYTLMRKVIAHFYMMTKNKQLVESYFNNLTFTEKGYVFDLMCKIDITGKIRYGNNVNQYCRSYKDLAKALNVSYNTLKQKLIPKLRENNIIRTVTIDKNCYKTMYISFNPILIVGGGYWDRWEILIWYDELLKHKLLTKEEIKNITDLDDYEIENERDKLYKLK